MKPTVMTAIALALGAAVAMTSYAQVRHDEKPHGEGKPSAGTPGAGPMTGMRHDECPHGTRKPDAKKKQEEPAADAEAGKTAK